MPLGFDAPEFDVHGRELPELARRAIRDWLETGQPIALDRELGPPAPVFVTLRNSDGSLRGCIGSLVATEPDVGRETVRSAVLAAVHDPRFSEVRIEEVDQLRVEVSVLLPEEPVSGIDELDPACYGVIVRDDAGRQGVLLPSIPGIVDPVEQVAIARRKAGIAPSAEVRLSRFRVRKFTSVPRPERGH
jgi:AmmeMemoRadiSam system protein A